jgi:hypothetical protein
MLFWVDGLREKFGDFGFDMGLNLVIMVLPVEERLLRGA